MAELKDLYRQVIMDHYKNPRNKGLKDENGYVSLSLKNPSCGDKVTMQLKLDDGVVSDVRFDGAGCSICCASASISTTLLVGKTVEEALNLLKNYVLMVTNQEYDTSVDFDELEVFDGIRDFPARVRCASLAETALVDLLESKE